MKHVQTAVSPAGQQYMVVAAPPGSALDSGGPFPAGAVLGGLVALVSVGFRAGRRGWRISVTPCDRQGRPTSAIYRERVTDQGAAEARTEVIILAISDGRWPDTPGEPSHPGGFVRRPRSVLSSTLKQSLLAVEPSRSCGVEYRPCVVTLDDGTQRDFVYLCEAQSWFAQWGVDPEDDRGKDFVALEHVVEIAESPSRLPARLAEKMYQAGESAMDGCIFQLLLRDGRVLTCETGSAVDFLAWPRDIAPSDAVDLIPHAGRHDPERVRAAPFAWCLYEN